MKVMYLSYPLTLSIEAVPEFGQVLAIGYFDGVHLGHQAVIKKALEIGRKANLPVSLMTFHPHPREVLGQPGNNQYLTPLEEKLELFKKLGVDCTYVFSFDTLFSQVTPQQFIQDILRPLQVTHVAVGFNFTFGHMGKGTPEVMTKLSNGSIAVKVIHPYRWGPDEVSSTLIKKQLQAGHIQKVNELLGYVYTISGKVINGEGRGRTIGIPTANIEMCKPFAIPGNGVYAVNVFFKGAAYAGVMNIGYKPTFSDDRLNPTLEVHILNFEGNIYGEPLNIQFISFIRCERKFASIGELTRQIDEDISLTRILLSK